MALRPPLVFAVFGSAEGAAGQVEGNGNVAGLVVFDDTQQGGEEGVHGLGVLAVAAHEDVLAGLFGHGVDAEEGAQGQGVSVNEQEGVIRSSHPLVYRFRSRRFRRESPLPHEVPASYRMADCPCEREEFYLIYKYRWGVFSEFFSQILCPRHYVRWIVIQFPDNI